MFGYIYETTNLINNKKYIGQSKKPWPNNYIGSGKTLKKAISKYLKKNFECKIIEICSNQNELNEKEIFWISKTRELIGEENCYNITSGGNYRDGYSHKISEEHKEKIKQSKLGKPLSKEHRRTISEATSKAQKNKSHNLKWIKNQSETMKLKIICLNIETKKETLFNSQKECGLFVSKLMGCHFSYTRTLIHNNKVPGYYFTIIGRKAKYQDSTKTL